MLAGLGDALSDGRHVEMDDVGERPKFGRDVGRKVATARSSVTFKVAVSMLGALMLSIMLLSAAVFAHLQTQPRVTNRTSWDH